MKIEEYIVEMKKHYINIENKGKCNHNKKNKSYCLECNQHLCKFCLESREHVSHNKIDLKEVIPTKIELEMVDKAINFLQNKKEFQHLKELYEIVFNTYIKYIDNYCYCININYILFNFIENNKSFKDQLSKDEYENIIRIKNRNAINYEEIVNKLLDENEIMKSK